MGAMSGTDANYLFASKRKVPQSELSPDKEIDRTAVSIVVSKLICEHVLSHPFTILRRQCQVHGRSGRYHLFPITLFSPCYATYQRQGVTVLWKGLGSAVFVRGFTLGVEDFFSKVMPWPKEINSRSTLKAVGQHFLLKCVSAATTTPLIAASLVEVVQSDIASEKPGIFDVFREGFLRLVSWTTPQTGRLLPIWILIIPSTVISVTRYVLALIATGITEKILKRVAKESYSKYGIDVAESEVTQSPVVELGSWFAGRVVSDVILYPVESVLQRLYLQGTRTIIDNLDDGISVIPIVTRYEGFWDCWRSVLNEEGYLGLYKGFGALVLQYTAEFLFLRAVHFLVFDVYGSKFGSGSVERSPEREVATRAGFEPVNDPTPSTSAEMYGSIRRDGSLDVADQDLPRRELEHTVLPAPISSRPSTLYFPSRRNPVL